MTNWQNSTIIKNLKPFWNKNDLKFSLNFKNKMIKGWFGIFNRKLEDLFVCLKKWKRYHWWRNLNNSNKI